MARVDAEDINQTTVFFQKLDGCCPAGRVCHPMLAQQILYNQIKYVGLRVGWNIQGMNSQQFLVIKKSFYLIG